jgi:hypothetical protein
LKASQDWYTSNFGWSTLRWQSNVPLDPSITVTVGPKDLLAHVGPCGPTNDESAAVLQLQYEYGCDKTVHKGGLQEIALSYEGASDNVREDPDGYRLTSAN